MRAVSLAVVLPLVAGCGVNTTPHVLRLPAYPSAPKILAHAEMRLTPQFAGYELPVRGARGFDPQIGGVLCSHAEALANAVFERVTVSRAPAPPAAADAVITPTIIGVHRTLPSNAQGDAQDVMEIEWRIEDARGRVVWVGTSKGEATGPSGTASSRGAYMETQLRQMVDRAFRHAYDLMIASPEIHALGDRVRLADDRRDS